MARKRTKSSNGEGLSMTVFFDQDDREEAAALEMAQLLAYKHGRRKQAVVAFLAAMHDHFERTGEIMSVTEITNALTDRADRSIGFTAAVTPDRTLPVETDGTNDGAPRRILANVPLPTFEDDGETLQLDIRPATSKTNPNQNFVNSVMGLMS